MRFGIWELLLILAIVVLLFGTKKLKNIGGDLGNAIKGFRSALREGEDDAAKNTEGKVIEGESLKQSDKSAS